MRKFCTFLLTAVLAMLASVSYAADVNSAVAEEFTSVASLEGKTFAIIDQANEKALYGTNNQNLGYNVYTSAFQDSNSGYMWKLVSLANDADTEVQGFYRLQLVTPSGADYNCWGMGGWLNSQPATGAVSFILGLNNQNGQDMQHGAVSDVQYVEGKGFTLKNIGTGLYQNDAAPAKYEEPTYWTFGTVASDYTPVVKELLAEGEALKATAVSDGAKAAYESAIANIDADDVENSQANMKIVDAAINELAKAQPTVDGADFTRAIANPSFETNSLEGWTSTDGGAPVTNGNFGKATGGVFVEKWTASANQLSNGSCLQEIAGLPNGEYTAIEFQLNGKTLASGDTVTIYAAEDELGSVTAASNSGNTQLMLKNLTSKQVSISANLLITENSANTSYQWCIGTNCMRGTTFKDKTFTVAANTAVNTSIDAEFENEGVTYCKFSCTANFQTITVYIKSIYDKSVAAVRTLSQKPTISFSDKQLNYAFDNQKSHVLSLYDVQGKLVDRRALSTQGTIRFEGVFKGVYVMRISDGANNIVRKVTF